MRPVVIVNQRVNVRRQKLKYTATEEKRGSYIVLLRI